jgi:hypothetical protein
MGFTRGRTLRVSMPSVLAVAWAAAQPGRTVALCNRATVGHARYYANRPRDTVPLGYAQIRLVGLQIPF